MAQLELVEVLPAPEIEGGSISIVGRLLRKRRYYNRSIERLTSSSYPVVTGRADLDRCAPTPLTVRKAYRRNQSSLRKLFVERDPHCFGPIRHSTPGRHRIKTLAPVP